MAAGSRVSDVLVRNGDKWVPIEADKVYSVVTNNFMRNGGDGYKTLAAVPAARRLDIGVLDADVFFNFIEAQPKDAASGLPLLQRLPTDLYSTKSFVGGR